MGLTGFARRRLIEPIWLGAAMSRAERTPLDARPRVAELGRAARRSSAAARRLRSDEHDIAALALERRAFCFAVTALDAASGAPGEGVLTPSAAWARYEARLGAKNRDELRAVLATDDALALERLDPRGARRARLALERVLAELLDLAEPRSPRELRVSRVLRSAVLGFVVFGGIALALWAGLAPHHVGRYKPVSSSSLRQGSQPIAVLTDDTAASNNVASTAVEESPWVRVDSLGAIPRSPRGAAPRRGGTNRHVTSGARARRCRRAFPRGGDP